MKIGRLVCGVSLLLLAETTAAMTGREILQEQKDRHSVDTEVATDTMVLVDSKGNNEQREVRRYYKALAGDEKRALVVFVAPADIRGTALMIWNHAKGEADQWLFLPSQNKLQRVARSSRNSYFMGTDFTYGDMEPEDIDSYDYTVAREETVDGQDCYVVEAVTKADAPKEKTKSPYSKRVLWVRKDILATVKIEFYDRRGTLAKTQTNHDFVNVKGTAWRPQKAVMVNHAQNHKTLIGTRSTQVNVPVQDDVFTERHILSGKHVEQP
ncbi:MAG: hypothetical protein A3K18_30595 [Lentisphaerae bacterium RIFOXYA12_64_32]|nr:MAG: hypothetical protein A3K18_30595 [Lentisphaerae bacterium RIFOXYA12_64_32]